MTEIRMIDLHRMRFLLNRLPMARFRVEKAMSRATRTTAQITGMPHGSGVSDPVASGVELLEAAREAYLRIRTELTEMQDELRPMIERLDDPLERTAMSMRYMDGHSAREIAFDLCYSERRIFQVLKDAEQKISLISVAHE